MYCGSFTGSSSSSSFRRFCDDSLLFFLLAPIIFFSDSFPSCKKKKKTPYPSSNIPAASQPCFLLQAARVSLLILTLPLTPSACQKSISLLFSTRNPLVGFFFHFSTSSILPCSSPYLIFSSFISCFCSSIHSQVFISPVLHQFFCLTYLLTTSPSSALYLPFWRSHTLLHI